MLTKDQRKRLLKIARDSIGYYLNNRRPPELSENDTALIRESGAFVTLREKGELRGCIGHLTAEEPLYLTIRDMAIEAAFGDPRFPEVIPGELNDIDIEISVLSELKRVESTNDIQLGVHGVLVRQGVNSGVFLPQVAAETGWSKEEFLKNLCSHKAGLEPDAWKDGSAQLFVFTAEIFSEKDA